jgi:transposase-like protein
MKQTQVSENVASPDGLTEGALGATGVRPSGDGGRHHPGPPDPEVPEQKPRRNFTVGYKLRILQQADSCVEPGQIGQLLRREGLYSSNLTTWRKQRDHGLLHAMAPKKRGRKNKEKNPLASRVAQLEKQNQRLEQKLRRAELIIEAQKKISEILGITQNIDKNEGADS